MSEENQKKDITKDITIEIEGGKSIQIKVKSLIIEVMKEHCKNNMNDFIQKHKEGITIIKGFQKCNEVKDVHRYNVEIKNGTINKNLLKNRSKEFLESKFNDNTVNIGKEDEVILLILESPHKDEYIVKDKKLVPIAPAQGDTGKNIEEEIQKVLTEINRFEELDDGKYKLIICNPVPYQTSLGAYHSESLKDSYKTLRDNVWKKMWSNDEIKGDFKKRLETYKPYLIINACTSSVKKYVTECVKDYLKYVNTSKLFYTTNHPAAWKWHGYNVHKIDQEK